MIMDFVIYRLCKLYACLMCLQTFFVRINHFPQLKFFTWSLQKCKRGSTIYQYSSLYLCFFICFDFPWRCSHTTINPTHYLVRPTYIQLTHTFLRNVPPCWTRVYCTTYRKKNIHPMGLISHTLQNKKSVRGDQDPSHILFELTTHS
jgi:hypothetical protein